MRNGAWLGLLHDFDYERWPEPPDHPLQGARILTEQGYPEDVIYAIKSHVDAVAGQSSHLSNWIKPCLPVMSYVDLITAVALVRPQGIIGMSAKSVRKKMKQKSFAEKVSRG